MLHMLCTKRGISMVEMLVAILLTTVALIGILTLQSTAWRTAGRSDYLGRAAGILYSEMEAREAWIMNPLNTVTEGTTTNPAVLVSGQAAAVEGDANYTVSTVIAGIGTSEIPAWRVTVTVTWPPLNSTGITENIVVTRQDRYRF
jgi:Tfp pilus assembly protein PilV